MLFPSIRSTVYRIPLNQAMKFTVKKIGSSIINGSKNLRIRNIAASAVLSAPRKDYARQLIKLWMFFCKRWRYVKDPYGTELLTAGPAAIAKLSLGYDGGLDGISNIGAGDCDCATIAFGALARSIGFPVRICTTAKKKRPMSHVFPQVFLAKHGWITTDPVLLPQKNIGQICDYDRIIIFDLYGNVLFKNK